MDTDIHVAVKESDGQEVKALADSDATAVNRIAAADGQAGITPLHVAVRYGLMEMVALLYGEEDRIVFTSSAEGGLLGSGISSLTGFNGLLGMQELVAETASRVGRAAEGRVDVSHDVQGK